MYKKKLHILRNIQYIGTHLNITGTLDIDTNNISEVNLSLKTINEEYDDTVSLNYTIDDDGIEFYLSEFINEGINLEELEIDTYYLFIEVTYNDNSTLYYSLKNSTEYENIEYYTLTENNKNNKINIKFNTYELDGNMIDYVYMEVKQSTLPDEVYDIVIDPGHGGADVGAVYGNYYEADLALSVANELKEELEELGLKVKITRDGTEDDSFNVYSVYDTDRKSKRSTEGLKQNMHSQFT